MRYSALVETCATHGLRYDPAIHDGCLLCRRIHDASSQQTASTTDSDGSRNHLVSGVIAVAVVGGALSWWLFGSTLTGGPKMGEAWPGGCPSTCADSAESCVGHCTDQGVESHCRDSCVGTFNDCLRRCEGAPKLSPGSLSFVYSVGDAPAWSDVEQTVKQATDVLGYCERGRGPYAARLQFRPDGRLARASVGAAYGPAAECIQGAFLGAQLQLKGGEYALVVHGEQPAESRPARPPPAKPAPPSAASTPTQAEDYLAQLNKMNPPDGGAQTAPPQGTPPAAVEAAPKADLVPMASRVGAEPALVSRSEFDIMKSKCQADGLVSHGCEWAVGRNKQQLTEMQVNLELGANGVHAYEMNRAGHGFDCLWFTWPVFSREQFIARSKRPANVRESYPVGTYLVAVPANQGIHHSVRYFDSQRKVELESAPWPAFYEVTFNRWVYYGVDHADPLKPVCMSFANDKPVVVYIGAGAWIDGPFLQSVRMAGEHMTDAEILSSLGLKGRIIW